MQFGHKTFLQGIKGKLCKHTLGLVYDRKKDFPVDPRITAVRFIRKRKAGRPRNLRPALTREPPLVVVDGQFQQPERPGNRGEAVPEAAAGGGQGEPTHAAVPERPGDRGEAVPGPSCCRGGGGGQGGPTHAAVPTNLWSSLPIIGVTDRRPQLQRRSCMSSSEGEEDSQQEEDAEEIDMEI